MEGSQASLNAGVESRLGEQQVCVLARMYICTQTHTHTNPTNRSTPKHPPTHVHTCTRVVARPLAAPPIPPSPELPLQQDAGTHPDPTSPAACAQPPPPPHRAPPPQPVRPHPRLQRTVYGGACHARQPHLLHLQQQQAVAQRPQGTGLGTTGGCRGQGLGQGVVPSCDFGGEPPGYAGTQGCAGKGQDLLSRWTGGQGARDRGQQNASRAAHTHTQINARAHTHTHAHTHTRTHT
jgi:hypothetical protein